MNRHTILIVDDDRDVVLSLEEKLSGESYVVRTADNGYGAIDILENEQVDLMFLDVQMQVMNGVEVLGELEKRGIWLPVIMLSDKKYEEENRVINNFGIIDFLKKPMLLKRVKDTVDEVIKNRGKADLIKNFGLSSMLQLIEMEKRTGILMLKICRKDGRIFFKSGKLMDIQVKGLSTEEALQACIDSLDEDREICIEYIEHRKEKKINMSLMEMVMEASRRKDEKENHCRNGTPAAPEVQNKKRPERNILSLIGRRLDSLKEVGNYIIADLEGEVLMASSDDFDEETLNAGIYLWAIGEQMKQPLSAGEPTHLICYSHTKKRLIHKYRNYVIILELMAITKVAAFKKKLTELFVDLGSFEEAGYEPISK